MRQDWHLWRHDISSWLLQLGGVLGSIGLIYLIWGIWQGQFNQPTDPERVKMISRTLSFYLHCCGLAVGLGLIGLFWLWRSIGFTSLIVSTVIWFLMPMLFVYLSGEQGVQTGLRDYAINALRAPLLPIMLVGLFHSIWIFINYLRSGPSLRFQVQQGADLVFTVKEVEKKLRRRAILTPISSCWKLPVVDKTMCDHCPVMHRRKPCWKLKSGCQCSPAIVDSLLTNLFEKQGLSVNPLAVGSLMTWQKGQKPPCHRCAIYLLHQQIKYDWSAPLFFFAPPVILFFYWDRYKVFYSDLASWVTQFWQKVAFTSPTVQDPLGLNTDLAMVFTACVLCLLVMVYAVKAIEFFLFRLFW